MKKSIILGAFALIALASCKKDYSCVCTYTGTINGTVTTTITDTKKNAETACNEGDSSVSGQTVACEIQ